jgi:hypothetical protein
LFVASEKKLQQVWTLPIGFDTSTTFYNGVLRISYVNNDTTSGYVGITVNLAQSEDTKPTYKTFVVR